MTSRIRLLPVLAVLLAVALVPGWSYPALSYESGNDTAAGTTVNDSAGYSPEHVNESTNSITFAYPTMFGDSGLVNVPTADVMPYFNFDVAVDFTRAGALGGPNTPAVPARFNFGISPNIELFGNYSGASNTTGYSVFDGGGKIQLINSNTCPGMPDLAVGARAIRFKGVIDQDIDDAYAVSSIPVFSYNELNAGGFRIRAHIGADYLHFSDNSAGVGGDFVRPFAGASYEGFGGSQVVLDYVPRIITGGTTLRTSSFSGALRIPITKQIKFEIGGGRPYDYDNSTMFAGLMYHVGETLYDPDHDEKPILQY